MEVLVWGLTKSLARAKVPFMLGAQAYKVLGPALLYHLLQRRLLGSPPKHSPHPNLPLYLFRAYLPLLAKLQGGTLDEVHSIVQQSQLCSVCQGSW